MQILVCIGTHDIVPDGEHGGARVTLPDHLHGDVAKVAGVLDRLLDDGEAEVVALQGDRVPTDGLALLQFIRGTSSMGRQNDFMTCHYLGVVVDVVS